jgi:hypothetical protein
VSETKFDTHSEPQRLLHKIQFSPVLNVRSRCTKCTTKAEPSLRVYIALISQII